MIPSAKTALNLTAALNFLDIENRTKIQFCPSPIILEDIMTKLDALIQHGKSKTGSEWRAEPLQEFFLASTRNSISTISTYIQAARSRRF